MRIDDEFAFGDDSPVPSFKPRPKFRFNQGDRIEFDNTYFNIYEATDDYVTIFILKKRVTAKLMSFMEFKYDALYHGPMIDWGDSKVHVTFKRKTVHG